MRGAALGPWGGATTRRASISPAQPLGGQVSRPRAFEKRLRHNTQSESIQRLAGEADSTIWILGGARCKYRDLVFWRVRGVPSGFPLAAARWRADGRGRGGGSGFIPEKRSKSIGKRPNSRPSSKNNVPCRKQPREPPGTAPTVGELFFAG